MSAKPAAKKPTIHDTVRELGPALTAMERRAYDAGLIATAQTINRATRKLGWEAAESLMHHYEHCQRCGEGLPEECPKGGAELKAAYDKALAEAGFNEKGGRG